MTFKELGVKQIAFELTGKAGTYVDLGDAKIDQQGGPLQGALKGDYKSDNMHVIALNLIWRF